MMADILNVCRLGVYVLAAAIAASASAAENLFIPQGCQQAQRPLIPDGGAISEEQLINTKNLLEQYLGEADVYLKCLKRYEDSLGEDIEGDKRVAIITSHNKVVDEMYLAGDEFNVALRKFNRRANP